MRLELRSTFHSVEKNIKGGTFTGQLPELPVHVINGPSLGTQYTRTANGAKRGILIAEKREAKSVFVDALKRPTHCHKESPVFKGDFQGVTFVGFV